MHMPNPRFAKYFLMSRRYEFMMSISAKARFALTLCLLLPATFARADIAATSSLLPARPPASGLFVAPMRMPVAKTTAIPTPPRPMTQAPTMQAIVAGTPGHQCRQAIRAAEMAAGIPSQLMAAIGRIESGRRDAQGQVDPWPWSINVEGVDHIYETRAEAIAAVRGFQAAGKKSIDVGCMQVNLMFHPTAFASIEQALRARQLIKIRFSHERDERAALAGQIAETTGAALIMQVGKVAVFYRPKPAGEPAES